MSKCQNQCLHSVITLSKRKKYLQLHKLSAYDLFEMLKTREISSLELTEYFLNRIEKYNNTLKSFITITPEKAREDAIKADRSWKEKNKPSYVQGIPIAIKDNICMKKFPCTCGSKILENFIPPYNATVIEKLEHNGAVITGKTNLDEFSMGSSTENSAFYTTKNPWDLTRVPGGSSGGSAAAVAAALVPWALGSDTGGSIRQPAAFSGITGLKPTYGLISRYGLVAYASSLDQIGILAKDVRDCAMLLNTIAGYDPLDSTSANIQIPDYYQIISSKGHQKLRIGLPEEFFSQKLDQEISNKIKTAAATFENLGFPVKKVSLPHIKYALPSYYIIATAEASSNLARYDGSRYGFRENSAQDIISMFKLSRKKGFGAEVKRRIMLGTYTLSAGYYDAYYLKAQKIRTLIKRDFDRAFEQCECILGPTTPTKSFKIGENIDDPLKMYLQDIFTVSVNLAGLPGLVVPCGFVDGLPVGMQLIGKPFDESTLLFIGYAFQHATRFHKMMPPGFTD